MRRHRHKQILIMVLVALVSLCVLPAVSVAVEPPAELWHTPEDGVAGAGAGRLQGPSGLVADPVTGHVYVADTENNRVEELTSWGGFVRAFGWGVADGSEVLQTCTTTCLKGLAGGGAGELEQPEGITVDSSGDVYVSEADNLRVQKFDPTAGIGGDEAEFLWTIGGDVDKTKVEAGGSTEAERDLCTAASEDVCQAGSAGSDAGQFDLFDPKVGAVHRGLRVAIAPTGELYVADRGGEGGTRGRIQAFDEDGAYISQFDLPATGYSGVQNDSTNNLPFALAVDPNSGDLYFAFHQNGLGASPEPDVYKLSPAGAVLGKLEVNAPTAVAVDAAGNVYVVAHGPSAKNNEVLEFDPSGKQVDAFAPTEAFDLAGLATSTVAPGSGAPGDLYVISDGGDGSSYESFVTAYGPPEEFELPPKVAPSIVDQYAASVDSEAAVLKGNVNPEFWKDTTYYVEYGTGKCSEGGCVSERPAAPGSTLTSKLIRASVGASVNLTGLEPNTTYHYRFVAESGGSEGRPVRGVGGKVGLDGEEGVFMTPALPVPPPSPDPCPNAGVRTGLSALLPDCRAYEMVSPVDKNGGDILTLLSELNYNARLDQSAVSGEAITFSSYRAFAGAQSGGWSTQYLSRRGAGGWSTEAISPPQQGNTSGAGFRLPLDTTFDAFSADLSTAWLYAEGTVLDPDAPGGFYNLFSRDDATGAYTAQIRAVPPHRFNNNINGLPELQGVSTDGRHMVFRASDNLVSPAPEVSKTQLYEAYREGEGSPQLRLVSILPNKAPATTGASAGIGSGYSRRTANVDHAVSEDGSRIYWTAAETGPGPIYVRVEGTETLAVSEAIKPVDSSPARFWAASADGSKALYDYTAGTHSGDLYEYRLASKKSTLVATKFLGLLGAAEDLSRFYFLSDEVLAAGATTGKPNLYLDEEGALTYIAALSADDARATTTTDKTPTPVSLEPYFHTARASADGRALAFTSDSTELAEAVAGYDNTDQQSGAADAEVYHYAAGRLVCVSCNPTGARPDGREILFGNQHTKAWAAARLPGYSMQTYQPRYLSDDGTRLYFDSYEALSPRDTNGEQDVYEWEALGSGDCGEESVSFNTRIGGCLSLISTGESPRDSEFIDASPTGRDVFFVTLSSLVPQDPGLIDLYDAREDGGYPSPQEPPASCEGEACQSSPAAPNDPSPASAVFGGPGDLVPALTPIVQPRKKTAAQVRAAQLAKALKRCRRVHSRVKRKRCDAKARKRYGTRSNSRAKNPNRRGK